MSRCSARTGLAWSAVCLVAGLSGCSGSTGAQDVRAAERRIALAASPQPAARIADAHGEASKKQIELRKPTKENDRLLAKALQSQNFGSAWPELELLPEPSLVDGAAQRSYADRYNRVLATINPDVAFLKIRGSRQPIDPRAADALEVEVKQMYAYAARLDYAARLRAERKITQDQLRGRERQAFVALATSPYTAADDALSRYFALVCTGA